MLAELLYGVGGWVPLTLGLLAIASLVVAPELFVATVQARLRGLLNQRAALRS